MFEPMFVPCARGIFSIPEQFVAALREASPKGVMYVREDEDALVISSTPLMDGRRRTIRDQMKVASFFAVTRLAIVDLRDQLRITPVAWRENYVRAARSGHDGFDEREVGTILDGLPIADEE